MSAAVVAQILSPTEAQRLTQRIKLTAGSVRDGMFRLRNLVEEAKQTNVWQVLGFRSWTEYLADTLGSEPMRLGRDERQELVEYLSGEGMSTRAIAPIVGVNRKTVERDISGGTNVPPAESSPVVVADAAAVVVDVVTGEVVDEVAPVVEPPSVRVVTGMDGKQYTTPAPTAPRRKPLTDSARDLGWDSRKVAERLQRVREDDRFSRNKEEVAALLRGHLMFTVQVCQDLLDEFERN